jgi:hypothetical protein
LDSIDKKSVPIVEPLRLVDNRIVFGGAKEVRASRNSVIVLSLQRVELVFESSL